MKEPERAAALHADLVLRNGVVWTVDEGQPRAQAVAIAGEEIIAVGDDAEMDPLIGPETQVYDLRGKLALPGFNDCHTHFVATAARSRTTFDLFGLSKLESIRRTLSHFSAQHPDLDWLIGRRWYPEDHAGAWPSRHDLDRVEDRRPVAIIDVDGHTAWVNTAALERLGYDARTPDPEGGTILRDPDGNPSGILFENAHEAIPREIELPFEEFSSALAGSIAGLNALGITSLSNNSGPLNHLRFCERMHAEGVLNLRINHWPMLMEEFEACAVERERYRKHPRLRVVGLKAFMDGVLSNRTAWLLEDYADAPGERGYPVVDPREMLEWVRRADAVGFQVIIHAIGDQAVRATLDIYGRVAEENGPRDRRHRIEHMELTHPREQARFQPLGVVASVTPMHLCNPDLDRYITARVGWERESYTQPWRNLVAGGAHLCFGTDWPAISLPEPDPLKQIFAAVSRVPPMSPGRKAWHPEMALSVQNAIRCCTLEPAYAEFQEHRKGCISVGKLADLCVLDRNIIDGEPQQILEARVVMTVFGGQVVYEDM
jgi:predicted amidohydrolase YtcJ